MQLGMPAEDEEVQAVTDRNYWETAVERKRLLP